MLQLDIKRAGTSHTAPRKEKEAYERKLIPTLIRK
jgi:hypothetical protein